MKITTQTLMLLGNPQHPDFGVYAKFITGMGTEVDVEIRMKLCDKCVRPFIYDRAFPFCMYCRGFEDSRKEPSLSNILKGHEHSFYEGRRNKPCKICGVHKALIQSIQE